MLGIREMAQKDMNLLIIFHALNETRHVTKAAKILGITQPTLSHALKRLRLMMNDQLFAKSSHGLVLTPLAESLVDPISAIVNKIRQDILERQPFHPKTLNRLFKIRTTDYLECLLIPPLVRIFSDTAPFTRVACLSSEFSLPKEELERGECDVAIAGFFSDLPNGFYQQALFTDKFQCAVSANHPRVRSSRVSLERFCSEEHLLIAPGGELSGVVDQALNRQKLKRKIVAGVSSFTASGFVTAQTDCILTAPSRLLSMFTQYLPLKIFNCPMELPDIRIVQVWHQRNHADQAHQWFRAAIKASLK